MKMYVAGQWLDKAQTIEVRNSYDNSLIDTVPRADATDVERALQSAERGAKAMARLTSFERWKILHTAAEKMAACVEELGTLISKEEGKILAEGRAEALRAVDTMMESAEEAKRVHGETVALDGAAHGRGKFGVTIRVPCGVVVAISPFNFPLNLVCHKVGPAIAGGNAVVLKPATDTPLSALRLTEILLEATAARGDQHAHGHGRRDRRPAGGRPAGEEDHLHGQPRHRRAHLQDGRHQARDDGAWLELARRRDAGCGPRQSRRGRGRHGLRQRGAGLHLDPARAHGGEGLRRLPRRAPAESRGAEGGQPARSDGPRRADDS